MARTRTIRRTRKKKKSFGFLPESLQAFFARRIVDLTAGALIFSGLFLFVALTSYDSTDPSMNTAGLAGMDIHNWAGATGAKLSDFILQTVGAAGFLICAVFIIWGVRLLRRQSVRPFILRIPALIITVFCAAVALAQTPAQDYLVHPYLGGSAGTLIFSGLQNGIDNFLGAFSGLAIISLSTILAIGAFILASAASRDEVAYVVESTKQIAAQIAFICTSFVRGAINWISHFNDPDYEPEPLFPGLKGISMPKMELAGLKARISPALSEEDEEEEEEEEDDTETDEDEEDSDEEENEDEDEDEDEEVDNRSFAQKRAVFSDAKKGGIPVVKPKATEKPRKSISGQQRFALSDTGEWELPPLNLLQPPQKPKDTGQLDEKSLRRNAELLQNVLADYGIEGEIVSIHPGPVVTLYELEPSPGTKSSKVISLADDIARSMAAISVRCAVVPGRNVIGIELPNKVRQVVYMQELLETDLAEKSKAHLPLALGKDIGGQPIIADLAKMPHLLVAGTTGSGKSVAVNTMILSLLYRLPPAKCRFIMIDPKMLELSVYDDIPHLLTPVVTEPGKAVVALKWAVAEMEERYRAMSKLGVRNIEGYNARLREAVKNDETIMTKIQTGFDPETGKGIFEDQPMDLTELPYIVVIVDEFADLMLVAGKDVENAIQRLAQMARAAGIHLIMATQRPSVDVITGVIKANFPTRISFQVTSKIDSRTILGEGGAEQLLGMGDMLYMAPGGRITRVHGPFVSDKEVEKIVDFLKAQGEPSYISDVTEGGDFGDSEVMNAMFGGGGGEQVDELYDQAVAIVAREGKASTSFIQRYLQIGYNRAARIIEEMERQGVVSKASPTGKREVLINDFSGAA